MGKVKRNKKRLAGIILYLSLSAALAVIITLNIEKKDEIQPEQPAREKQGNSEEKEKEKSDQKEKVVDQEEKVMKDKPENKKEQSLPTTKPSTEKPTKPATLMPEKPSMSKPAVSEELNGEGSLPIN